MIYQPFRTVDAREEACEHNWPTFCSLPSQALARFCLTLFGFGLFCNHPGLFSLWAPLRCAASWKRMPTQMHVLHCQSGTQQLPAFWCKKKFPFAFFLGELCPYLLRCGLSALTVWFHFCPPVSLWLAMCAYDLKPPRQNDRMRMWMASVLCQRHGVEWTYVE